VFISFVLSWLSLS